jgi:hypothetical protein
MEVESVKISTESMKLVRQVKKFTGISFTAFIAKAIENEAKRLPKSVREKIWLDNQVTT